MRLIDANELMEHVWRDRLDSREAIAEMVNNAPTVRNATWVSVKDRLPDDVKDVIVCDELGLVYPAYYYTCDECWMYSFAAERCEHKITHWMPLPEPPESEDDADRLEKMVGDADG